MNKLRKTICIGLLAAILGLPGAANAEPVPLARLGHVHGIALDPGEPSRVLLATHQGLFAASPNGLATRVSKLNADFTALTVHPKDPGKFFASAKSAKGGNLGVMVSEDGGATWRRISDAADGQMAFQAITISPTNPDLMYGAGKDLQVSRDGGLTWRRVAPAPESLLALSASSGDENILLAATMKGLLISHDGGQNWRAGYFIKRPATMVHSTASGRQFAFIYGTGLVETQEPSLAWKTVAFDFQDRAIMGIVVSPDDPGRFFAVTDTGVAMTSADGGKRWTSFQGSQRISAATLARGKNLFEENCEACHGVKGIGERPDDPEARDEYGFAAPALNDDAHAWHHPDQQLVEMILNGSRRNERMIAWKETLSRDEAGYLVTYIKSLWSFRSLACQGGRHTSCMQ